MVSRQAGLASVLNVIGVSSCKGGVGKSTVSVNLAFSLSKLGKRVGIFDADLYGPSLPTLVGAVNSGVVKLSNGFLAPVIASRGGADVSCMSYGFVSKRNTSGERSGAFLRGPMASRYVSQLIQTTEWGALDYLVVDLPPGTGDILLTLGQNVSFDGAVMVTTPQQLSFVDVLKGLDLFTEMRIPILAAVENMAYFTCRHGEKHELFGKGHADVLAQRYGIPCTVQLPLHPLISSGSDTGQPIACDPVLPDVVESFRTLAAHVDGTLTLQRAGSQSSTVVSWDERRKGICVRTISGDSAQETVLTPAQVRQQCRCALCVEEMSGMETSVLTNFDPSVYPISIQAKGNYAVSVVWSDGHTGSVFPLAQLREMKPAV